MTTNGSDLPPPVNHVFVDYENVHTVDPSIFGTKTVHLILLLGAQKAKFDATLVEQLLQHAGTVELIRLESSGRNALDFSLAYYVGRAVAADPGGHFHIVSKDKGYDPLIAHLLNKHIHVRRHDDFFALTFSAPPKAVDKSKIPSKPAEPSKQKVQTKSKVETEADKEKRVLDYLRKPGAPKPRTKTKLLSFLVAHLGHKVNESETEKLVGSLSQAGHLFIDDKGKVNYFLD